MASRTTSAVTFGLPSRSPPIQDPGRRIGSLEQVRVRPARPQRRAHFGVDLRDDLEEGRRVIPQPGFDLVLNLQPGQPDQRGLPQRQDVAAQFGFDVAAVVGVRVPVQAQPHQLGDAVLGVEDGAAPGLGGMRGDHRRHQRAVERVGDGRRVQVGRVEFEVGGGQAAVLRRLAGCDVDGAAPLPVDVLGDVGQQREMGEGPDDGNGLVDVDAVEHAGQLGAVDLRATHPERLHPGALDEVEHLFAVLLAHGVAEDGAEQPDVLAHRLGGLAPHLGAAHGADRRQRVSDLQPSPSIGDRMPRSRERCQIAAIRFEDVTKTDHEGIATTRW